MTKDDYIALRELIARTYRNPDKKAGMMPWNKIPEVQKILWRTGAEAVIREMRDKGFVVSKSDNFKEC